MGKLKRAIEVSSEVVKTGVRTAVATGGAAALGLDPVTALLAGSAVGQLASGTWSDILNRQLSRREAARVERLGLLVIERLQKSWAEGVPFRDDIEADPEKKRFFSELVEGATLIAQREHEENKLRYIANMTANFAIKDFIHWNGHDLRDVDPVLGNWAVRAAEGLTWTQMRLLAAIGNDEIEKPRATIFWQYTTPESWPVHNDLHLLREPYGNFITAPEPENARPGRLVLPPFSPELRNMQLTQQGRILYGLLSLEEMPMAEIEAVTGAFADAAESEAVEFLG